MTPPLLHLPHPLPHLLLLLLLRLLPSSLPPLLRMMAMTTGNHSLTPFNLKKILKLKIYLLNTWGCIPFSLIPIHFLLSFKNVNILLIFSVPIPVTGSYPEYDENPKFVPLLQHAPSVHQLYPTEISFTQFLQFS